eukprot:3678950-Prymnesium_polylepis.1
MRRQQFEGRVSHGGRERLNHRAVARHDRLLHFTIVADARLLFGLFVASTTLLSQHPQRVGHL